MLVQMMWVGGSTEIVRNGEDGEEEGGRDRSDALFPTDDYDPFSILL